MEFEIADVCPLVLFLLVEALLELTLFLETVFFGHLPLFLLCLDRTAFFAEDLHLAVEHLVFAELALQRTIEQRNLDAWLQANLFEAFLAIAEHPGVVAYKLMFQAFANHLVGGQQVGSRNTLTIGWVGNHNAGVQGLLEVLEVLFCHRDIIGQSCCLDIHACGVDSFDIYIVAVDVVVERSLLGVVIINLVEELRVEVGPLLKGELLAEQTWCHVAGDKGSLDEQGAGTAHRVNEVGLALPPRHQNHSGSQHLVQGSFD